MFVNSPFRLQNLIFWVIFWLLGKCLFFFSLNLGKTYSCIFFFFGFRYYERNIWSCFNFCSTLGNFFSFCFSPSAYMRLCLFSSRVTDCAELSGRLWSGPLSSIWVEMWWIPPPPPTRTQVSCELPNISVNYLKSKPSFQPFWSPPQEFTVFGLGTWPLSLCHLPERFCCLIPPFCPEHPTFPPNSSFCFLKSVFF